MIEKTSENMKKAPKPMRLLLIALFLIAILTSSVFLWVTEFSFERNLSGQATDTVGEIVENYAPIPGYGLEPPTPVISPIAAGNALSMVITEDGSLWAWGWNNNGQLGDGTDIDRYYPVKIMSDMVAVSLNVGDIPLSGRSNTLVAALASDGTLFTWGTDIREMDYGLGFFPDLLFTGLLSSPLEVMNNVSDFSAGNGRILAITSDGTLWGWGTSVPTDGGLSHQPAPVQVMSDVISVSAGGMASKSILSDNTLWGWGSNRFGQISMNNQNLSYSTPVEIMDDVVNIVTGTSRNFAITSDGTLWGWGSNANGRLGDGTNETRYYPIRMLSDVLSVSAGLEHTMAITSDGILWGWGYNRSGQLGDGTTENRLSPIRIKDDVVYVSAGAAHTLAVTSDGALWAWGSTRLNLPDRDIAQNQMYPVRVMDGILLP